MGAGNAKLAYGHYAGTVPAGSLLALVFMALTTKDTDDPPLFWGGHDSLALSVLGRKGPYGATDRRAVERLITPLFRAGAIEVDRHSAPGRQVRYRLNLQLYTRRNPSGEHPTHSGNDTRQNASGESENTRRKVVATPDGNRRTEEQEEELLQDLSRSRTHPGAQASDRVNGLEPMTGFTDETTKADPEGERRRQLDELEQLIATDSEALA